MEECKKVAPQPAALVDIKNFDSVSDLLDGTHPELVGGKCQRAVVLLSSNLGDDSKGMDVSLELIKIGLDNAMGSIRGMDAITSMNPNGEIDDKLKAFLLSFIGTSMGVFNSLSVRQANMDEFHLFDVLDLLGKIDALNNTLKSAM